MGRYKMRNSVSEKIYCEYDLKIKKLISNGKSLVIKTKSSYYIYPLEKQL